MDITYEAINGSNRAGVNAFLEDHWGGTVMAVRGRLVDMTALDGIAALSGGEIVGLVTYEIEGDNCELISLDSARGGMGVGSALVERAGRAAAERGCRTMSLITTNDNTPAMRFYQKRGFTMTRLFPHAVTKARAVKPSIPLRGENGIRIEHELEFVKELKQGRSAPLRG